MNMREFLETNEQLHRMESSLLPTSAYFLTLTERKYPPKANPIKSPKLSSLPRHSGWSYKPSPAKPQVYLSRCLNSILLLMYCVRLSCTLYGGKSHRTLPSLGMSTSNRLRQPRWWLLGQ